MTGGHRNGRGRAASQPRLVWLRQRRVRRRPRDAQLVRLRRARRRLQRRRRQLQQGGERPLQDRDRQRLPTNADQQRELVVRRLAAEDSDIDLIGMDVIWTAEFAEAGWIKQWDRRRTRARPSEGVLAGAARDRQVQGQALRRAVHEQHPAALVPQGPRQEPPKTWDEMIDQAETRQAGQDLVQVQGARYEGLVVWFNSLVAVGRRRDPRRRGRRPLGAPAVQGGRGHEARWPPRPPPTRHLEQQGGPGAARLRGRQLRVHGQLPVRLRRAPAEDQGAKETPERTWRGRATRRVDAGQAEPT